MCRVEPPLEVVQEPAGDGQVPVPLRPPSPVRVGLLLGLLPGRTAGAAADPLVGTTAAGLLTVMVMVMMVRGLPVLVLLGLLPVIPPVPAVVLVRYHAVHVR